jgi:hypothetical protein
MENNINGTMPDNKATLQLRSKEVSEVMGNIPSWISGWGLLIILFLFTASIFLIANIHCLQTLGGTASLKSQQATAIASSSQDLFVQVTISAEHKPGLKQRVALYLPGKKNSNQISKINCLVDKINMNKDSCVLLVTADKNEMQQLTQNDPLLFTSTINCQLALNVTVFEKVVNSIF